MQVLIHANVSSRYISRFRDPEHLQAEPAYYLTNMVRMT
jgi:hypothetical protein